MVYMKSIAKTIEAAKICLIVMVHMNPVPYAVIFYIPAEDPERLENVTVFPAADSVDPDRLNYEITYGDEVFRTLDGLDRLKYLVDRQNELEKIEKTLGGI